MVIHTDIKTDKDAETRVLEEETCCVQLNQYSNTATEVYRIAEIYLDQKPKNPVIPKPNKMKKSVKCN